MNQRERDFSVTLSAAIAAVPFPSDGGGSATATTAGFLAYAEDMRALMPFVQRALMGMAMTYNIKRYPELADEFVEGLDYHNPYLVLEAIEQWIAQRKRDQWKNYDRHGLEAVYEMVRQGSRK